MHACMMKQLATKLFFPINTFTNFFYIRFLQLFFYLYVLRYIHQMHYRQIENYQLVKQKMFGGEENLCCPALSFLFKKHLQGKLAKSTENEEMLVKWNMYKHVYTHTIAKYLLYMNKIKHVSVYAISILPQTHLFNRKVLSWTDVKAKTKQCRVNLYWWQTWLRL